MDHSTHGSIRNVVAHAPPAHDHANHGLLTNLLLGGGLVVAAVVAAPFAMYGMDALGLINVEDIGSNVGWADTFITQLCSTETATGLAATSGNVLSHIPLIGGELAKGGLVAAVTSGVIGIGGRILGNYVAKNDDGSSSIRWGSVIKTAALVTSLLVASPAIFTAISMGITAISLGTGLVDPAMQSATEMLTKVTSFFGSTGNLDTSGTLGALGAVGPHLVTCATPIIAAGGALFSSKKATQHMETEHHIHELEDALQSKSFAGRVMRQREALPLADRYPAL